MTIFDVLDNLDGVRETSRGRWVARCPVHDDTHASLSVAVGDRVPVLLRCFACAAPFSAILRAVQARAAGVTRE